ncbi:MAG: Sua5/YciO/YrdC/YwlC family protein [Actinomycetes bacterium]|jgi:L-threonylcarbamoyladenylate synthase
MTIVLTNDQLKKKIDFETQLFEILEILRSGSLICAALENAYVLIADPTSEDAVVKLKEVKGIQEDTYFPLLVANVDSLKDYSPSVTPSLRLIGLEFWPGPLNLEVQARTGLPWTLGAVNEPSVLIARSPSSKFLRGVLELSGPLMYSPAAVVGDKAPKQVADIAHAITEQVAVIIDSGPCILEGIASTVNFQTDNPKMVREGSIKFFEMNKILPSLRQK